MSSPQIYLGKKAAKAAVKHSVHGTVSKAERKPFRTATLLASGAALGLGAGFLAGRRTAKPATGPAPVAQQTPPPPPVNGASAPPAKQAGTPA